MNKVITINLNGRAYQLEEQGYEALRRYLDGARAKLGENPDKDEIMADFEQAIAEKCDTYLSGAKTVVTAKEIDEVIAKMGPVEGNGTAETHKAPVTKRLFRIREGAWLFGVCNGLAAYFNLDVALVRVLFVLFTLITQLGGGIILYLILAIVLRPAQTDDDFAAAHGAPPFTAHDFFERVHGESTTSTNDPHMDKRELKARMRQLKSEWRAKRKAWKDKS